MIDIERRLIDLGDHIAFPETPDFGPGLRRRLAAQPERVERRTWRRLALVAVAAAVVVALAAVAYPPTREVVARFLHLRGVTIERTSTLPSPRPSATPTDTVGSGQPVTLEEARRAANFTVRAPTEPTSAPTIHLGRTDSQPVISLEYPPSASLPDPHHLGIGLLVTEFRGDLIPEFVAKFVGPDTTVEDVQVDGVSGFWLAGAPHQIAIRARNGEFRTETLRLAENTLVWERDGVTYRIESALLKADALRVAASLH
jgi:hypothetical protein